MKQGSKRDRKQIGHYVTLADRYLKLGIMSAKEGLWQHAEACFGMAIQEAESARWKAEFLNRLEEDK